MVRFQVGWLLVALSLMSACGESESNVERVWEPTVAWFKYMLNGDEEAKKMFVGDGCGLCSSEAEFEYGANSKLQ